MLLQICSGFVFHPSLHNQSLIDHQSPVSFGNISRNFALKYFDAVQNDRLIDFFELAFVPQNPCYEAATENLMNYATAEIIFHPRPLWIDSLSVTENIDGLLVWTQREFVKEYAKEKLISLDRCSVKEIGKIESSREFAEFLFRNEDRIVLHISQNTKVQVSAITVRTFVRADLVSGLRSSA